MNQQENYGCVESGLKLTVMIFVIIGICVLVFGCASQKPCGDYAKWESKVKFRSK